MGLDSESKKEREKLISETLPKILQYTKQNLILGGDWNCIINNIACRSYPEQKRSNTLKRLTTMYKLHDTYRKLHPSTRNYSRYYSKTENAQGATRLDRI